MLESMPDTSGRYSIYAWNAVRVIQAWANDPFELMNSAFQTVSAPYGGGDPSLGPGWLGFLSYEGGYRLEPTAGKAPIGPMPVCHWALYDTPVIHDRQRDVWVATTADVPADLGAGSQAGPIDRLDAAEAFVDACDSGLSGPLRGGARIRSGRWNLSRAEFERRVRTILRYIRDGDVYQVNLARQYVARLEGDPYELYEALCQSNPAAYAAFLRVPGESESTCPTAVLSSSPELLLGVRGRNVVTRPIKGTMPRRGEVLADERARQALATSAKDRAELNMIIDLERNDLGRVCEYGSVRVLDEGEIEAHPTVYHRSATVVGRLREGIGIVNLLRATFPGGSVTGAPKVRAMQIIRELEADPRGPYCGAIGYVGLDGTVMLNLAIRTMWVHGGVVRVSVGSGIVADSDPAAEFAETADKARGMLAALERLADAERASSVRASPIGAGCR